jgi:membrane-associated phospholipid phosphatase
MVSVRPTAVAVSAAAAAVVVYAAMWLGYLNGSSWLNSLDSSSLASLHGIGLKHPAWVRFWDIVCTVFGPAAFRLLGAVAVVVVAVQRKLRATVFLLVSIQFSEFVARVAKDLVQRPRPVTALVHASWSSFPSGHAVTVMVAVLSLLTVFVPMISIRPLRVVAIVAGALIVLAVGFGRVALNVHHPSDVVGGWALGYLYFAVCAWVIRPLAPRLSARVCAPATAAATGRSRRQAS